MLIVFSGLAGTGKSTIARQLALEIGAVWLRIDSLEQAMRDAGVPRIDGAGYRAAQAAAEDNLRLGRTVIADCVNPWMSTRDAWRDVGRRAGVRVAEVETVCSNEEEHRRRVESRASDVPGLLLPDWRAVTARDYHAWTRERCVVDTAGRSVAECVASLRAIL
jgi:predicted kinase